MSCRGSRAVVACFVAGVSIASPPLDAQVNGNAPYVRPPFAMKQVATMQLPWRIAFLPDGRMLITEKVGALWLVTQDGVKTPVANLPASEYLGRAGSDIGNGGMLGVYASPTYANDQRIYLTYSEPGPPTGSGLALTRARLVINEGKARLEDVQVIWRDGAHGVGGQVGGAVASLLTDNSSSLRSAIVTGFHHRRIRTNRSARSCG